MARARMEDVVLAAACLATLLITGAMAEGGCIVLDDCGPSCKTTVSFQQQGVYQGLHSVWVKSSDDVYCTADPSCTETTSWSASTATTISGGVGLNLGDLSANLGYSVQNTASVTSTYGYTIQKNDNGYVGFSPAWNMVYGWSVTTNSCGGSSTKEWTEIMTPSKLASGELDGHYGFLYT